MWFIAHAFLTRLLFLTAKQQPVIIPRLTHDNGRPGQACAIHVAWSKGAPRPMIYNSLAHYIMKGYYMSKKWAPWTIKDSPGIFVPIPTSRYCLFQTVSVRTVAVKMFWLLSDDFWQWIGEVLTPVRARSFSTR